jgi:hypothetical protein
VLVSALAMPVVLPMTEHWSVLPANVRVTIPADPETLLEELQARLQAKTTPDLKPAPAAAPVAASAGESAVAEESTANLDQPAADEKPIAQPKAKLQANPDVKFAVPGDIADRYVTPAMPQSNLSTAEVPQAAPVPAWLRLSILQLAALVYLAVAGVLCARLLYGLLVTLRVWKGARPVQLDASPLTDGLRLRVSDSVSSPVTIGSTVVLPSEFDEWESEKLRIVLAQAGGLNANCLIWPRRSATGRDWKRPPIAQRMRRFCSNSRPRRAQP